MFKPVKPSKNKLSQNKINTEVSIRKNNLHSPITSPKQISISPKINKFQNPVSSTQNNIFANRAFQSHLISPLVKKNIHSSASLHTKKQKFIPTERPFIFLIMNRGEIAEQAIISAEKFGAQCLKVYLACPEQDKNSSTAKKVDKVFPMKKPGSAEEGRAVLKQIIKLVKRDNTHVLAEGGLVILKQIMTQLKQTDSNAFREHDLMMLKLLLKQIKRGNTSIPIVVFTGYGFLSENADFAKICEDLGVIFAGPNSAAMRLLGDKAEARKLADAIGIPVIQGYDGDGDIETLKKQGKIIGYPLLLKDPAGGGGMGIYIIESEEGLIKKLEELGDKKIFMEKYLKKPFHFEIQVFTDAHGNFITQLERDCSEQNKHHAKETHKTYLAAREAALRKHFATMSAFAKKLHKAAPGSLGAITYEFLIDHEGNIYFLEVNTRVQVEGPAGLDLLSGGILNLLEMQIFIALGGSIRDYLFLKLPHLLKKLSTEQLFNIIQSNAGSTDGEAYTFEELATLTLSGNLRKSLLLKIHKVLASLSTEKIFEIFLTHSENKCVLEVRLNAVDFHLDRTNKINSSPGKGTMTEWILPENSSTVRVSTAIAVGDEIDTSHVSPLLALIAVGALTMEAAYKKMADLLEQIRIKGVPHNLAVLKAWIAHGLTSKQPSDTGTYTLIEHELRKELDDEQHRIEGLSADLTCSYSQSQPVPDYPSNKINIATKPTLFNAENSKLFAENNRDGITHDLTGSDAFRY